MNKELDTIFYQILAGKVRCVVDDKVYYVCAATPEQKLEASIAYNNVLWECSFHGVMNREEMAQMMIDNGLWTAEEENELSSMHVRLDALKAEMYGQYATFQSKRVEKTRKMLEKMRQRQSKLSSRKYEYDMYTREGVAELTRLQQLVFANVELNNGQMLPQDYISDGFGRSLLDSYMHNRPNDLQIRELSKTPKWRMLWSSGRQEGRVFGVPSARLTDEQQNIIAWSKLYDNIGESSEPPSKDVMDDDDLLDGWLIVEQKKREKEQKEGNTKGTKRGAQEVFIPAETPDDARRIEAMNDAGANFTKRQRMALLHKHGTVEEQKMPDSKQAIAMKAAQEFRQRMHKK